MLRKLYECESHWFWNHTLTFFLLALLDQVKFKMQTILGVYQNNILMKFKKFTKELKSWFKFATLAKPNP